MTMSAVPSTTLDQIRDSGLGVLVVAVRVDQDVGPMVERVGHTVLEGSAQSLVPGVTHEVDDSVCFRNGHGGIS